MTKCVGISSVLILVVFILTGCNIFFLNSDEDKKEIKEPPAVVFLEQVSFYKSYEGEYVDEARYYFYDKDGTVCYTQSKNDYNTIINEYMSGNLNESLIMSGTADPTVISDYYQVFYDICNDKNLEFESLPEGNPMCALTSDSGIVVIINWYVCYYDEDGVLRNQMFHFSYDDNHYYVDDEDINSIFNKLVRIADFDSMSEDTGKQ